LDPASKEAQKLPGLIAWHLRDLSIAEEISNACTVTPPRIRCPPTCWRWR
jgi:hypothetical protein